MAEDEGVAAGEVARDAEEDIILLQKRGPRDDDREIIIGEKSDHSRYEMI